MRHMLIAATAALLAGASVPAAAFTAIVSVDSHSGPWDQTVNPTYDYGLRDEALPTAVSSGFDFSAGGTFTITYLDGLTSAYNGVMPYSDAGGDTSYVANGNFGSSGSFFPSAYMDHSTQDIYLMELVGTFADASGAIVGTPFAIGSGPVSFTTPAGATQLLLGFNDDIFDDNSGALRVQIDGPSASTGAVPEPASWAMTIGGLGLAGGALRRRRRVRVAFA